jgi:predicted metal-dependent phosphoesterase TrpH
MTPEELVAQAASLGLEVLAITDHDTTEGVAPAQAAAQRWGITVVPGVEISAISGQEEIHLLGYFINLGHPELQMLLARTREARQERAQKMLARLAKLGMPIEWERLTEISAGSRSVGRPHVAAALLKAGYVSSYDEAFSLWIGRGCPAYVERYKLTPEEAIQLVRRSGGLPVLSHPRIYSRSGQCKVSLDLNRWLPRLRDAGLVGLEVYYPNYPHRVSRDLLTLAVQHGLLITGGSDFHGGLLGNGLGSVAVPWAVWEGLKRRHRLSRTRSTGQLSSNTQPEQGLIPDQVNV